MNKHAPGPWSFEHTMILDVNGYAVANVVNCNDEDARLISTAPELLETLKALTARMRLQYLGTKPTGTAKQLLDAADAAISKAESN